MDTDLKQRIGLRVKHARIQKGLTQAELAEAVDKTYETISKIETGRNFPKIETLSDIARQLSVALASLFDDDETDIDLFRVKLAEQTKSIAKSLDDEQLDQWVKIGLVMSGRMS